MDERYIAQIAALQAGETGQKKLSRSAVVVIGCGAIGTVTAAALARAGIGKIKLIDKDSVEYRDLTTHALFDEEDVKNQLPKAMATERHLKTINSAIEIQCILVNVDPSNVEELISNADLVVGGLNDNPTSFLINDACKKHKIPWVHGKAIAFWGTTMNIIPDATPCYQCVFGSPLTHERIYTVENAGAISSTSHIIGALQFTEAIKILTGSKEINRDLITIDVWKGTLHHLKANYRSSCLACAGKYQYLEGKYEAKATRLCDGGKAVEVLSPNIRKISLPDIAEKLSAVGQVKYNEFMLRFNFNSYEIVVFPDGRAIFKNTSDEALALKLYNQYIGG